MVKRSYHRRQPIHAAREWFAIRPLKSSNVVIFPKVNGFWSRPEQKSIKKYQKSPINSA
jgi:hypothetical protein